MSRSTRREQPKREPRTQPPHSPPGELNTEDESMQEEAVKVDQTIGQIENLYRSLTGHEPPAVEESAYAPIPPESDPRSHIEGQVDRLLRSLAQFGTTPQPPQWVPEVSVWEGTDGWLLCVDLPGLTREQIHVRLEGNVLVVSGERRDPATDEELEPRWVERRAGTFYREVPLPQFIAPEVLRASMKEGVLEIRLPRVETQTRRADIAVN